MQDNFLKRIFNKPPFLFPWIAGAHLLMVAFTIWLNSSDPFPGIEWLQSLWVIGFAVSWIFICDMKKWAAYAYLAITSANLLIYYFAGQSSGQGSPYATTLILAYMAVFFSFLLLFFFKRFE